MFPFFQPFRVKLKESAFDNEEDKWNLENSCPVLCVDVEKKIVGLEDITEKDSIKKGSPPGLVEHDPTENDEDEDDSSRYEIKEKIVEVTRIMFLVANEENGSFKWVHLEDTNYVKEKSNESNPDWLK